MLNEALRTIKLAWAKDKVTFRGKHYNVKNLVLEPKPKQKTSSANNKEAVSQELC